MSERFWIVLTLAAIFVVYLLCIVALVHYNNRHRREMRKKLEEHKRYQEMLRAERAAKLWKELE